MRRQIEAEICAICASTPGCPAIDAAAAVLDEERQYLARRYARSAQRALFASVDRGLVAPTVVHWAEAEAAVRSGVATRRLGRSCQRASSVCVTR